MSKLVAAKEIWLLANQILFAYYLKIFKMASHKTRQSNLNNFVGIKEDSGSESYAIEYPDEGGKKKTINPWTRIKSRG